ncbi:hypothetical protein DL96DRAFT_393885 [Flagelloscypha sp. PMI_526]|nr:hypothetical protein DL96DRAFT_393885 [Flagelloscypha sp. PMI_526]
MAGVEILGAIGSAIAIVEAILVTTSYLQDVKNAKREKEKLEGYLEIFESLISGLKSQVLQSSSSTVHKLVDGIEKGLNDIKREKNNSGRVKWKFTKEKLKGLWLNLEHMKTFLMLGLVSDTSDTIRTLCADNSSQYQAILNELRFHASEHQTAVADLRTYITHESIQARKELKSHILTMTTPLNDLLYATKVQDRAGIQDWLSPNYSIQNELDAFATKRFSRSGEWILASEKFLAWLRERSSKKILVLAGPAGCGKTFLSAQVSEHIAQLSGVCLPVFIKHANQMDAVVILRRLLSAVLVYTDKIPEELEELRRVNSFDRTKLFRILQNILAKLPNQTYIVLDALDELDIHVRKDVFAMVARSLANVKIFIASRPLPLLQEFSCSMLDLESSNIDDLRAFITTEVTAIGRGLGCPEAEVDELVSRVNEASSELFLLASLHIRMLRQCQRRYSAIHTAKTLPRTTEEHYRLSIDRIRARGLEDSETSDAALSSLLWVWKAKRPLTLLELSEAVASIMNDLTGRIGRCVFDSTNSASGILRRVITCSRWHCYFLSCYCPRILRSSRSECPHR